MITYGLIDQHPIYRLGLQIFLERHFGEVNFYSATNLESFLKIYNGQNFEVIIIDIEGEINTKWLKLVELCKLKHPQATLIIHSEFLKIETVIRLVNFEIKGITLKGNNPNEILDCIERTKQGHIYISPELEKMAFNSIIFNQKANRLSQNNNFGLHSLTEKQHLMATYLIKGMKTTEIAEAMKISVSTVSTVKATILRKTNSANVIELVNLFKIAGL